MIDEDSVKHEVYGLWFVVVAQSVHGVVLSVGGGHSGCSIASGLCKQQILLASSLALFSCEHLRRHTHHPLGLLAWRMGRRLYMGTLSDYLSMKMAQFECLIFMLQLFLPNVVVVYALSFLAVGFYVLMIPERWLPGNGFF